jgi:hypothetical protein
LLSDGTGTSGHFIPKLLEDAVGAKFTVVMGYQGGAEQDLAFERGEVVCRSLSIPTFFAREPFISWRKNNVVRILMQSGRKRDVKLPDVPTIHEIMNEYKTPAQPLASDLHPCFGRPGASVCPAARIAARPVENPAMVPQTMSDPAFLADVKNRKLEADPITARNRGHCHEAVNQPVDVINKMKKLFEE